MKKIKTFLSFCLMLTLLLQPCFNVYSHNSLLTVEYDDCVITEGINDGEEELWYWLLWSYTQNIDGKEVKKQGQFHIGDNLIEITYRFETCAKDDPAYTWTTDIYKEYIKTMSHEQAMAQSEITANEIKEAYADSMKKWNNVYYYINDNGTFAPHKIITIREATNEEEPNIRIYPVDYQYYGEDNENNLTYYAAVSPSGGGVNKSISDSEFSHFHYSRWNMYVNVNYFYEHGIILHESNDCYNVSAVYIDTVNMVKERTGQHELGHVLGLYDIDTICNSVNYDHHSELLMGYGSPRSTYAKYKDIAGVSITRGFHTDADHKWMIRTKDDGSRYLICALCNGTRTNFTLENGMYEGEMPVEFGSCGDNHSLDSGNMLLVATDCERDFYKCMKCRYIEEVPHNHISNSWTRNANEHIGICVACNDEFIKQHIWKYPAYVDSSHTKTCDVCGYSTSESHNINYYDEGTNDGMHIEYCSLCEYLDLKAHYFNCTYVDADTHSGVCRECGYAAVLEHSYEYKAIDSTYHILTCKCGATSGSSSKHIWTATSNENVVKCKTCARTKILAPGEIIPIIKTKPIIIEEESE